MNATEMLRQDHAAVSALIQQLIAGDTDESRRELVRTLAIALESHVRIEEEVFYPPLAGLSGLVPEARQQLARMTALVRSLEQREPASPDFILGVGELRDAFQRHVAELEGSIFPETERRDRKIA